MDKKYIIVAVIALIAIISIGSVSAGWFDFLTGDTERGPDEIVCAAMPHGEEPEYGFDPMHGWGFNDGGVEPLIQSTLLKHDHNADIVNDLATDYEVSDDFKTYTVNIRDDVKFTDGSKLTAKDVAFSYNTAKETGEATDLSMMESAEAVNDTQVKFTLNKADSAFVHKLTDLGIVPEATYDNASYGQNPIGSGPYKLAQWDKGQQVILERNDDYYGKKPYYSKITNLFLDRDAAFSAVKSGDVDLAEVHYTYADEDIDGYHLERFKSVDMQGISLPVTPDTGEETQEGNPYGNNVTADPAIREALNIGIDREKVIDTALNGYGEPSTNGIGFLLPFTYDNFEDGKVDEAKKILDDAGWKDTDGDGIREKNGTKASWTLWYYPTLVYRESIAIAVSEQAKELGLDMQLEGSSWDDIEGKYSTMSIVWGGGGLDPSSVANYFDSRLAGSGYNNPTILNDSSVDALIDQARCKELNSSYPTWSKMAQQANSHDPYIWIGSVDYTYFVNDNVDISPDTATVYGHGGDIWSNVYDWKNVNATA